MKDKKAFTVTFEGEKLDLKNGFVGGYLADQTNCPMGFYAGSLSIEDMGVALMTTLRAVIKTNTEEQSMSMAQSKAFIEFALKEAIRMEREALEENNVSLEQHKEIVLKMRRDNTK